MPASTPAPAIRVAGLRKSYGRQLAVDDISFDVAPGEIFGLVGPNGAGKTTTMECVEGLRVPDRGTIRVLGLAEKRDAWFMTLSGGQKQRLFIALALINDPELVFLDELTTGLDPQARRAIWDLVRDIRARDRTVFLTTHQMEEAERLCDRVAIVERGRVIDIGAPAALVDRHCPERSVVLVTEDANAAAALERVPRLVSLEREGARFVLHGSGDGFVSDVIGCLSEQRIRVSDFRTVLPSLEDVFLRLTGRSIRD